MKHGKTSANDEGMKAETKNLEELVKKAMHAVAESQEN